MKEKINNKKGRLRTFLIKVIAVGSDRLCSTLRRQTNATPSTKGTTTSQREASRKNRISSEREASSSRFPSPSRFPHFWETIIREEVFFEEEERKEAGRSSRSSTWKSSSPERSSSSSKRKASLNCPREIEGRQAFFCSPRSASFFCEI
jgi:hypothetical protein